MPKIPSCHKLYLKSQKYIEAKTPHTKTEIMTKLIIRLPHIVLKIINIIADTGIAIINICQK